MLPPSLGSRATVARAAPGAEREPGFLPAPLGAPATLPNPGSLQRHLGLAARSPRVQVAAPWWVSGSPSPSVMKRTSPASARRSGSRRLSRPWPSVSGPPPPPSGAHGREEHFPGGSTPLGELFRSERAIPWANRKLARAWRARRNQRVTRSPRRRRARERSELKRQRGHCLGGNNAPEPGERQSPSTKTLEGPGREPLPNPDWSGRKWDQQAAAAAHSSSPASWWSGRLGNSSLASPCARLLWEGFGEKRLK